MFLSDLEGVVFLSIDKGTSHHKGWLQLLYIPSDLIVFVDISHTYF